MSAVRSGIGVDRGRGIRPGFRHRRSRQAGTKPPPRRADAVSAGCMAAVWCCPGADQGRRADLAGRPRTLRSLLPVPSGEALPAGTSNTTWSSLKFPTPGRPGNVRLLRAAFGDPLQGSAGKASFALVSVQELNLRQPDPLSGALPTELTVNPTPPSSEPVRGTPATNGRLAASPLPGPSDLRRRPGGVSSPKRRYSLFKEQLCYSTTPQSIRCARTRLYNDGKIVSIVMCIRYRITFRQIVRPNQHALP